MALIFLVFYNNSPALSWLHGYLAPAGINPQWVATCERVLVLEKGLSTRDMFAALPVSYLDDAHLTDLGLTTMSVRLELRRLHARLNAGGRCNSREVLGLDRTFTGKESGEKEVVPMVGTGTDVDESESVDSSVVK